MTHETNELERWSADWRSADDQGAVSMSKVRRGVRRYVWLAAANWMTGLLLTAVITALAWRGRQPELIVAAVATWGLVIVSTAVDLYQRRGTWRAASSTTDAYLDLARRRLVARLRGLKASYYLIAAEVAFFLAWIPWVLESRGGSGAVEYARAFGFLALVVAIFAAGTEWLRRRRLAELAQLDALRSSYRELDRAA